MILCLLPQAIVLAHMAELESIYLLIMQLVLIQCLVPLIILRLLYALESNHSSSWGGVCRNRMLKL